MDLIWNMAASSVSSSVLQEAKVISGCFSEAFSKMGLKAMHGPHHEAQKSMMTMSLFSIVSLKLSAVSFMTDMVVPPRWVMD
jgi:hypothetical protein